MTTKHHPHHETDNQKKERTVMMETVGGRFLLVRELLERVIRNPNPVMAPLPPLEKKHRPSSKKAKLKKVTTRWPIAPKGRQIRKSNLPPPPPTPKKNLKPLQTGSLAVNRERINKDHQESSHQIKILDPKKGRIARMIKKETSIERRGPLPGGGAQDHHHAMTVRGKV